MWSSMFSHEYIDVANKKNTEYESQIHGIKYNHQLFMVCLVS